MEGGGKGDEGIESHARPRLELVVRKATEGLACGVVALWGREGGREGQSE